jgi:hypothetical protein
MNFYCIHIIEGESNKWEYIRETRLQNNSEAAHMTDVVKRSYHLMIDGKAVCGEQHVWQVWFDYITSLPEASSL